MTATALFTLTKRNLKIYFRDYMTIFYSLLSMFITLGLMVFFLGEVNVESITQVLGLFPGRDAAMDANNAKMFVMSWTGGGIISINAVTVTLACFSGMIEDRKTGRLNAIYTAPVNRGIISVSYIAYAWVASVLICIITLAAFEAVGVIKGMSILSLSAHIKLIGIICVNSWTFASLMYMLALLVKTGGAWGAIGTVVGTLVGFFGGIYFPLGSLKEGIQSVIKCFPVIYSASAIRKVMLEDITAQTFEGVPSDVPQTVCEKMGVNLTLFGNDISIGTELAIVAAFGVVFLLASIFILKHNKLNDR